MKRYKVGTKVFDDFDKAIDYMKMEGYCVEDIEFLTNFEQLKNDAEKIPDESSAMTPIEFVRKTSKDKGSEPTRYKNQPKQYDETLTTKNYLKEYYLRGFEALTDKNISSCPFCSRDWDFIKEELSNRPENLSFRTQNKEFESPELKIRETHLFYFHPSIAKLLHKLGIIQQFVDVDGHLIPTNPKNVHSLSKEELAQQIQDNPKLRRQFYRRWIKSLQK